MQLLEEFDQLKKACENALSLLNDMQLGLYSWNGMMHNAINELDDAVSKFKGERK